MSENYVPFPAFSISLFSDNAEAANQATTNMQEDCIAALVNCEDTFPSEGLISAE